MNQPLKKEINNDQFKFLVLSDIHVSDNESHEIRLNELVEKFNTDKILSNDLDFVTATGDNVSYLYSNRDLNRDSLPNNKLRSYINAMSNLNVPYHSCMGNHEYKIDKKRDALMKLEAPKMREVVMSAWFTPRYCASDIPSMNP